MTTFGYVKFNMKWYDRKRKITSGLSGALAYFGPKNNIYVAGTVNQVAHPDISFKTMIKLTQIVMKK